MRPAAALVYLASVARVAAIQYGFPSVKSETSSFIDVNPVSVADGSLGQFEKKLKFANLTSDLPPPFASISAPLSTCSSVVVVVHSTSNDMLNSFVLPQDSFVLPQDNIELAVELAVLVPTASSPTCTIFTTCPSSTDRGTTTTSPLAAGVESPWNLTLPGGAKDPADHALSNAGFGNSVSPIPALADVVPQIEGASAGMPFIASPSIFTDGSCDDGRTSPPSWFNPFLYVDDESRRRVRFTDRDEIGTSTKKDFMAFRWFAVSFVVSFFEAVAISLCLAGNLLEWTLITLPCLGAYLAGLFTMVASIKLLLVVITAASKIARFAWTPVSTSISVGCILLFRLLEILRTIVRALLSQLGEDKLREHYEMHYEAASKEPPAWLQMSLLHCPPCSCADTCQPRCDGTTTPSWRLRTLWRLHFAVSCLDDRLLRAQGRLIHLDVKTNIRREQYLSADYIFHFVYNLACSVARTILHLTPFAVLCLILTSRAIFVAAADDATKGMPIFNGQRDAFVGWFMLFSGYVAWKATDTYQIVDGTETRPAAPATAEEPVIPGATVGEGGIITNQATINALTAQRDEWRAQKAKVKDWEDRNRKLYGLLLTAMPTWLRTSLYNSHSGNGLDALQYLRTTFDAGDGSGSDHAFHLKRIGESVIEPRREICEDDLRKQYDMQMTAKAAIIRTGKAAPDDATLIAMFDNALPHA